MTFKTDTALTEAETFPVVKTAFKADLSPQDKADTLRATAADLVAALQRPPYFACLRGLPPRGEREPVATISQLMAITEPTPPNMTREKLLKVSFTHVRINPDRVQNSGTSTAYSRTNQPLSLHTDSSYNPAPHALVAFQMVQSDPGGGDTVLATVDDIVAALSMDQVDILCEPRFPFGKGRAPVLVKRPSGYVMRYYRNQIDASVEKGAELDDEGRAALDALDAVLQGPAARWRFHLASGEVLFLHNHKILHGRTGFASDSTRLMYRFRMHCGALG